MILYFINLINIIFDIPIKANFPVPFLKRH